MDNPRQEEEEANSSLLHPLGGPRRDSHVASFQEFNVDEDVDGQLEDMPCLGTETSWDPNIRSRDLPIDRNTRQTRNFASHRTHFGHFFRRRCSCFNFRVSTLFVVVVASLLEIVPASLLCE